MASSFRDWTGLHPDLLDFIVTKVCHFPEWLRFCGICPQWRSVALGNGNGHKQRLDLLKACHKKPPMLMIKTEENTNETRGLYSVPDGITYNLPLPLSCRHRFIGSSHGWLLCVEEDEAITLLNPLTNSCISLPRFEDSIYVDWKTQTRRREHHLVKGILTADPHVNPNNYTVAVIYHDLCELVIYTSADQHWKFTDLHEEGYVLHDIVSYKNDIYCVTNRGELVQVEIDSGRGTIVIDEPTSLPVIYYLVDSLEELLLVQREYDIVEKEAEDYFDGEVKIAGYDSDESITECIGEYYSRPITNNFKIFKLSYENESEKWVEIDDIGEQALFVGDNHSVSISILYFPSLRSNSIYYTNQHYRDHPPYKCYGPDEDSGFFNLSDKSCHSHHLLDFCNWHMKPPIWFIPNLATSALD